MSPGRVGGDPEAISLLASAGPGQAFALDHRARVLDLLGDRHERANAPTGVDVAPAVAGLRWVAGRIERLDRWVRHVAAALAAADRGGAADVLAGSNAARRLGLLAFGPAHPLADAALTASGATPFAGSALPVERLAEGDLDRLAAWERLPAGWRDRIHRERLRRWSARLEQRIAALPHAAPVPGQRLVTWFDRHVVDLVSPVTDLHVTREERIERLRAEVTGVERLLAVPGLRILSFEPASTTASAGPAVRVAFGDVDHATHLAVLLPGTSTGLHQPWPAVADARALQSAAASSLGAGRPTATVLDLYDAPADLGRAADPATAHAAGEAAAAFLPDLPPLPHDAPRRTTLVGHSYGALTAAHTTLHHPVDALVLLGAPGVGVVHRDELGADEVWAALAPWDPIRLVADLDEAMAAAGHEQRRDDPAFALGPDPTDPEFGARRLPTTSDGRRTSGHLAYLDPRAGTLPHVAAVVAGTSVRPGRPPTRDRRG